MNEIQNNYVLSLLDGTLISEQVFWSPQVIIDVLSIDLKASELDARLLLLEEKKLINQTEIDRCRGQIDFFSRQIKTIIKTKNKTKIQGRLCVCVCRCCGTNSRRLMLETIS